MLAQFFVMLAVTFTIFVLFFLFMGIGYMVKKEPLRGSCGRVANMMGDEVCTFCGDDPNKCESMNDDIADARDSMSASKNKAVQLGKSAI